MPVNQDNYRSNLSLVYHRGFATHARASAPGILSLLEPVRERGGLVLEIGCGSGLLTRELVRAGHRVIATDASPAMLDLARGYVMGAMQIRELTVPADPLPPADAIVSVGHALSYLPDEQAISQALIAIARALRPGGLFAIDLVDIDFNQVKREDAGRVGDDWAIITRYSYQPGRCVRAITTFAPNPDGSWQRDDEIHIHTLIDARRVPDLLAPEGVEVTVRGDFGGERLPPGLAVLIGRRTGG